MIASCTSAVAQAGRIWQGKTPPTTIPSGFSKSADVWNDTISQEFYKWNGKWYISAAIRTKQIPGPSGKDGIDGKDGVSIVGPEGPQGPKGDKGDPGSVSVNSMGSIRWVGTENEFASALQGVANGSVNGILIYQSFPLTQLAPITNIPNGKFHIEGFGNRIFDGSTSGLQYLIGGRATTFTTKNQILAAQSQAVTIANLTLDGKGKAQNGILLDYTYSSSILNCEGYNFTNNYIWTRFALFTSVEGGKSGNIGNIAICFDRSQVSALGSIEQQQSNGSTCTNHRNFLKEGQFASFAAYSVSGVAFNNCCSENSSVTAQYSFYINTLGATNCKRGSINGCHGEGKTAKAMIYIRAGGESVFTVSNVETHYVQTFLEMESVAGYFTVNLNTIPFFPSGTMFKTSGNECMLQASLTAPNYDLKSTANWVGGVTPYYYNYESNGAVGATGKGLQKFTREYKLNGKNVVTQ